MTRSTQQHCGHPHAQSDRMKNSSAKRAQVRSAAPGAAPAKTAASPPSTSPQMYLGHPQLLVEDELRNRLCSHASEREATLLNRRVWRKRVSKTVRVTAKVWERPRSAGPCAASISTTRFYGQDPLCKGPHLQATVRSSRLDAVRLHNVRERGSTGGGEVQRDRQINPGL